MTVRDAQRAIEPGSVAQGDRAGLEQGLSEVLSGAGGGAPAPAQGGSPGAIIPEDPVGALLSGSISGGDTPLTDGLSVGPGAGPAVQDPMAGSRANMIRTLATEATSPLVRNAARLELRRMVNEAV